MTDIEIAGCPLCSADLAVIAWSAHWTIILNENQATLGRVYFALRRHETDITLLTADEQADLWRCLSTVKCALDKLFAPDHVNFVFHMNLVGHVHAHLYPRYKSPRTFAGAFFEDPLFGRHYNHSEERILTPDVFTVLLGDIRSVLAETGSFEFDHPSLESTH